MKKNMSWIALTFVAAVAVVAGCTSPGTSAPAGAKEAAVAQSVVKPVKTGVYVSKGLSGGGAMEWMRLVKASPELELTLVDSDLICAGVLDSLDMLVMPGGSSPAIKRALGTNGTARIKDFIRRGGGYIGTCAGCCLLMEEAPDPSRGINVMPFYRSGSKGRFLMPIALNDAGAAAMGLKAGTYSVQYSHGPILEPSKAPIEGAKFEVWGTNRSDSGRHGTGPEMYGRAAIVGGTYGKGKVFVTSCHPEYYESSRVLVRGAFRYVTGRDVTFPVRPRRERAYTVGVFASNFRGMDTAKSFLELDDDTEIDVMPLSSEDIRRGALDHVDALLFPHALRDSFGSVTGPIVNRFASRGGFVLGWGGGLSIMPKSGTACKSGNEAVKLLKARSRR
jgi:putative intracellular protease/amidase